MIPPLTLKYKIKLEKLKKFGMIISGKECNGGRVKGEVILVKILVLLNSNK